MFLPRGLLILNVSPYNGKSILADRCDKIAVAPEQRLPVILPKQGVTVLFASEPAGLGFDDICQLPGRGKRVRLKENVDMMLTAWPTIIDEHSFPEIFAFCEDKSVLAKKLYNAALFRIRQVFTGWDKDSLTDTQLEVAAELYRLACAYPRVRISRVLSYSALEKLMRVTGNPDFFAGLPMQTAQAVVRRACNDFSNWLKSLREYKKHPEKYLGRPRIPHYCKSGHKTFELTNQDAILYRDEKNPSCAAVKLPGITKRSHVLMKHLPSGTLKTVTVKPYYGKYVLTFVFENADPVHNTDLPNIPLWKQRSNIGKRNNQTFDSIPHARLRWMIEYKALAAGITVVEQEESYTSKADVTAGDPIPVYGQEREKPFFSGKRITRGLYRTASGLVINADGNGGANILRKAMPDAWAGVKDFSFLAHPEVVDFFALNRKFGT